VSDRTVDLSNGDEIETFFNVALLNRTTLSGEQKQALLTAFVLKALETVTMQPRSYVFSGKFLPSLNAIRNMDISMPSANWLEVGILVAERQGQRRIGFGGEILPPSDILPSTPTFR